MTDWELMASKLINAGKNLIEDVRLNSDEIKAFGELALLKRDIELFLQENWDEVPRRR